jgi:hypothetical protein
MIVSVFVRPSWHLNGRCFLQKISFVKTSENISSKCFDSGLLAEVPNTVVNAAVNAVVQNTVVNAVVNAVVPNTVVNAVVNAVVQNTVVNAGIKRCSSEGGSKVRPNMC